MESSSSETSPTWLSDSLASAPRRSSTSSRILGKRADKSMIFNLNTAAGEIVSEVIRYGVMKYQYYPVCSTEFSSILTIVRKSISNLPCVNQMVKFSQSLIALEVRLEWLFTFINEVATRLFANNTIPSERVKITVFNTIVEKYLGIKEHNFILTLLYMKYFKLREEKLCETIAVPIKASPLRPLSMVFEYSPIIPVIQDTRNQIKNIITQSVISFVANNAFLQHAKRIAPWACQHTQDPSLIVADDLISLLETFIDKCFSNNVYFYYIELVQLFIELYTPLIELFDDWLLGQCRHTKVLAKSLESKLVEYKFVHMVGYSDKVQDLHRQYYQRNVIDKYNLRIE